MPKKRTIIEKAADQNHPDRVIVEESVDPKDQPAVLAYRLGTLEQTVKDGFQKQTQQISDLIQGFVTEKELHQAKEDAAQEHIRIWGAINGMKRSVRWWVTTGIAVMGVIATAAAVIASVIKN